MAKQEAEPLLEQPETGPMSPPEVEARVSEADVESPLVPKDYERPGTGQAMLPAPPDAFTQIVIAVEQNAQMVERMIIALVTKATYPSDWVDFDGVSYLDSPGAERVLRLVPWSLTDTNFERIDLKRGQYGYLFTGTMIVAGRGPFQCEGYCDTTKPFYANQQGGPKEHNIRSDARSKMIRDGVVRLLGLRGIPTERLVALGLLPATTVEFDKKEKPQGRGKKGGGNNGGQVKGKRQFIAEHCHRHYQDSVPDDLAGLVSMTQVEDVEKLTAEQLEGAFQWCKADAQRRR